MFNWLTEKTHCLEQLLVTALVFSYFELSVCIARSNTVYGDTFNTFFWVVLQKSLSCPKTVTFEEKVQLRELSPSNVVEECPCYY